MLTGGGGERRRPPREAEPDSKTATQPLRSCFYRESRLVAKLFSLNDIGILTDGRGRRLGGHEKPGHRR